MITGFTLGGVCWIVEVNNERLDDKECYGLCVYDERKIYMQDKSMGKLLINDAVEETLYHEVIHAILDTLGERELSSNEEFVKKFATLLYQFEKTKL